MLSEAKNKHRCNQERSITQQLIVKEDINKVLREEKDGNTRKSHTEEVDGHDTVRQYSVKHM